MPVNSKDIEALTKSFTKAQEENLIVINNGGGPGYIVVHADKGYNVSVDNGVIVDCTCAHRTKAKSVCCKHMIKVAMEKGLGINIASKESSIA